MNNGNTDSLRTTEQTEKKDNIQKQEQLEERIDCYNCSLAFWAPIGCIHYLCGCTVYAPHKNQRAFSGKKETFENSIGKTRIPHSVVCMYVFVDIVCMCAACVLGAHVCVETRTCLYFFAVCCCCVQKKNQRKRTTTKSTNNRAHTTTDRYENLFISYYNTRTHSIHNESMK